MGRKGLLIKQFLNNAFVTTAIVLIVLSVVALWYDGTMICISTIFETLLLSVVCEVIKHMMYKIDIANIYLGILLHYLLVLAAVLIFGYAFNWVNQLVLDNNLVFVLLIPDHPQKIYSSSLYP